MLNDNPKERFGSDVMVKLSYFRKASKEEAHQKTISRPATQRESEPELSRVSKTILRSTDRMGSVEVKEDKKATFTRNASLNKNISFTDSSAKQKSSSIFDIFRRTKVTNTIPTESVPSVEDIKLRLKDSRTTKKEIIKDMLANT